MFQLFLLHLAAQHDSVSTETGTASFYAKKFEGRR